MELEKFKFMLQEQGVSFDIFEENYFSYPLDFDSQSCEELIRSKESFRDIIYNSFDWFSTPEGPIFWSKVYNQKRLYIDKILPVEQEFFPDSQYGAGINQRELSNHWEKWED